VKKKLAIIGNGMATCRLLDELGRRGGFEKFEISIFSEEPVGSYNRILLNRVLSGDHVDEITTKPPLWYVEKGVRFFPGATVTRLSHAAKRLWTADGSEHAFDQAVFATGSIPLIPPIAGIKRADGKFKEGIFAYRTVADVEQMRKFAKPRMHALVIGGGLLGLEAAKGLHDLRLSVTVVHLFDTLMNRQMDKLGGQFLKRSIEQIGIEVRTAVATKGVHGEHRVDSVEVGGEPLHADMLVFAAGIKPRIDLAKDSDVPTNAGIKVGDRLETLLPDLFAVGECAEHNGIVQGTVQPIYEQCEVLADVLTGANPDARYRGSKVYTKLKVAGVEVASMGDIEPASLDDEVVQVIEERRGVYRKLIIRRDKLQGAVLVGDTSSASILLHLLDNGEPLPDNRLSLFTGGEGAASGASSDREVCNCHRVRTSTLLTAIRGGCDSLPKLSSQTKAGTGCGSCRGQLADLILKNAPTAVGSGKGQAV
jgi:nitrite reductase (NADH) large subunit